MEDRNNYSNVIGDTACGYVFIVDKEKFNFSSADLVADDFWYRMYRAPFVLDWAVGGANGSCETEKTNKICVGGECTKAPAGVNGYRCKCLAGYEGNAYLANGCYGSTYLLCFPPLLFISLSVPFFAYINFIQLSSTILWMNVA